MLTNLIGIVLAFITVMLLLSMVVMALVQLTQATLRLRGRNLLVGISALIESEGLANTFETDKKKRRLSPKKHADRAADVLNATTAAKLRPVSDPNSLRNVLRGPATSWAEPRDIARAIRATQEGKPSAPIVATPVPKAAAVHALGGGAVAAVVDVVEPEDALADKFRSLEPAMCDRFARTMQMWTAIWGLVVAIVFQVNTPALLQMLSTSQAKRDAVLALVPSVLKQAETTIPAAMSDDFVDRALTQLAADPVVVTRNDVNDMKARLEQVSGSTDSRDEMLGDLRGVLAGVEGRDAIVRRYGEIIDTTATHDVGAAITTATASVGSLDSIDIRPWGHGGDFYGTPGNVIGVLLTAILLSFGAPFWFEQLKNVASLRDALSKKPADAKT